MKLMPNLLDMVDTGQSVTLLSERIFLQTSTSALYDHL